MKRQEFRKTRTTSTQHASLSFSPRAIFSTCCPIYSVLDVIAAYKASDLISYLAISFRFFLLFFSSTASSSSSLLSPYMCFFWSSSSLPVSPFSAFSMRTSYFPLAAEPFLSFFLALEPVLLVLLAPFFTVALNFLSLRVAPPFLEVAGYSYSSLASSSIFPPPERFIIDLFFSYSLFLRFKYSRLSRLQSLRRICFIMFAIS